MLSAIANGDIAVIFRKTAKIQVIILFSLNFFIINLLSITYLFDTTGIEPYVTENNSKFSSLKIGVGITLFSLMPNYQRNSLAVFEMHKYSVS